MHEAGLENLKEEQVLENGKMWLAADGSLWCSSLADAPVVLCEECMGHGRALADGRMGRGDWRPDAPSGETAL